MAKKTRKDKVKIASNEAEFTEGRIVLQEEEITTHKI